jgi:hypothetical protein
MPLRASVVAVSARMVELTCPGCSRTLKQTEQAVVDRARQGKPFRCLMCGKELTPPQDLVEKLAAPPPAAPTRRLGRCPACLRPAQAQGHPPAVFGACCVKFRCDAPGHGSFDVPATSVATSAEVDAAVARFPPRPTTKLLELALRRRVERGALEAGEATRLADLHDRLAKWRPTPGVLSVPWSAAETGPLIAPFLFETNTAHVDPKSGCWVLRSELVLDGTGKQAMGAGSHLALNAVGIGLALATGTGFTVSRGEDAPPEHLVQETWVRLKEVPAGCELEVATAQQGEWHAYTPAEHAVVAQRIATLRPTLERYVRALALGSGWLRGAASKAFTGAAARARLLDVGADAAQAEKLAPEFVVDHRKL